MFRGSLFTVWLWLAATVQAIVLPCASSHTDWRPCSYSLPEATSQSYSDSSNGDVLVRLTVARPFTGDTRYIYHEGALTSCPWCSIGPPLPQRDRLVLGEVDSLLYRSAGTLPPPANRGEVRIGHCAEAPSSAYGAALRLPPDQLGASYTALATPFAPPLRFSYWVDYYGNRTVEMLRSRDLQLATRLPRIAFLAANCRAEPRTTLVRRLLEAGAPIDVLGDCLSDYRREDREPSSWLGSREERAAAGWPERKLDLLRRYRFVLAFESHEGVDSYVTEKFYHGLLAGAVPLYRGAPNVDDFSPAPGGAHVDLNGLSVDDMLRVMHDLASLSADEVDEFFHTWRSEPFPPSFVQRVLVESQASLPCRVCEYVRRAATGEVGRRTARDEL